MSPHGEYASDHPIARIIVMEGCENGYLNHSTEPKPAVTIITALGREEMFLLAAGRSVASFARLIGDRVEWLISCDGPVRAVWAATVLKRIDEPLLKIHILGPVSTENQGPARTRNRALSIAHGRFIGTLDSDDIYKAEGLAELYKHLNTSGLDWAAGQTVDVDIAGKPVWAGPPIYLPVGEELTPGVFLDYATEHGNYPWGPCASLVSTEALRGVGGWDESSTFVRSEDVVMWVRLTIRFAGFWTNTHVLDVRANPRSLTRSTESWNTMKNNIEVIRSRINNPDQSLGSFAADIAATATMELRLSA
jgi:glycosyltransferase involved in cell wall biosynthesis